MHRDIRLLSSPQKTLISQVTCLINFVLLMPPTNIVSEESASFRNAPGKKVHVPLNINESGTVQSCYCGDTHPQAMLTMSRYSMNFVSACDHRKGQFGSF